MLIISVGHTSKRCPQAGGGDGGAPTGGDSWDTGNKANDDGGWGAANGGGGDWGIAKASNQQTQKTDAGNGGWESGGAGW